MSLSERLSQMRVAGGAAARAARRAPPHGALQDPFGPLKRSVHEALLETLGPQLYDAHVDQRELEQLVTQTLQAVLQRDETPMTTADRVRVAQEVSDDILGHGPLEPYLRDPEVTEIMVNGYDQIYVERDGLLYPADAAFADEAHLRRTIDKIVARVGRRVDEASPMVDARLPDGSRVNAVVPPVALDGSLLTIRKFAVEPLTVGHLIQFGTMTPQVADLLRVCVQGRLNIVIGGGTGSGKTTTLNVLSSFVPEDERIVTIEDAAELQLRQEHVLRLESRPPNLERRGEITIRDLVRNALRMRPDRIIVGEVARRGHARHAPGHEHRPRRLDHHHSLQLAAGHAVPHGDDGDDGQRRADPARDPRADGLGDRPDRASGTAEGRLAADHPDHRGAGHRGRRRHAAGPVRVRLPRRGRTRTAATGARCTARACARGSSTGWLTAASRYRQESSRRWVGVQVL